MNYIGSKYSLLSDIRRVLDKHGVPADGLALDLFSGTGVVAQALKTRGHVVHANDWQYYSYVTNVALIEQDSIPEFGGLLRDEHWRKRIGRAPTLFGTPADGVLAYLNHHEGRPGPFYEAYCEGGTAGRQYFSKHNGLRIQTIRDEIKLWRDEGLTTENEMCWLVACLIESADRVANTASVYGAYLKHVKASAHKRLALRPLEPVNSPDGALGHKAHCEDAARLLDQLRNMHFRLVYIDPPYNARQYNSNYHILETIARWDVESFVPRGVTGLREAKENRSDYCLQRKAEGTFRELFGKLNAEYVLFSYNNEGLLSDDALRRLFDQRCDEVHFERVAYKRFRADTDGENRVYSGDETTEYLIMGKLRAEQ